MKKIKFKGIDEKLFYHQLNNGLEVYMVPNNKVSNFYITYSTKFGSLYTEFKNDKDSKYKVIPNGVAHFLEHLTFKMPDGDASDYFSTLGSSSNAFTSFKVTTYEVLGNNKFKENLKHLLNFVNTPFYTDENVQSEKGIICEEIKTTKDNPYNKLYFGLNKCLFQNSNMRFLVCGEEEDVLKTTTEDILNAYNYFYNPANMYVIITGNFNPDEAISIIEEEFIKYNHNSMKVTVKSKNEPLAVNVKDNKLNANINTSKVSVGFKMNSSIFNKIKLDKYELFMYLSIIINSNFGYSSELKEELVCGNVINYPFSIEKYELDKLFVATFTTETDYPNRVINVIKNKFNNMNISNEDFNRKKRVYISNYIQEFDDIETLNESISDEIIQFGYVRTDCFDLLNNLSYDTCLKVLKALKSDNVSSYILDKKE